MSEQYYNKSYDGERLSHDDDDEKEVDSQHSNSAEKCNLIINYLPPDFDDNQLKVVILYLAFDIIFIQLYLRIFFQNMATFLSPKW
jgi:hypothetical protein